MSTFVHLNGHSEYSTDGNASIKELVAAAKADGQDSLALTDTNLAAALAFRAEAHRQGIKPIIGLDVRLLDDAYNPNRPKMAAAYDLTLLAEDRTGWHNLVAISNTVSESGRRTHTHVDYDLLAGHAEGLIALTGGRRGPIDTFLDRNDVDTAREHLTKLENALGTGRVFLEASSPAAAQLLSGVFQYRTIHMVATARYRQAGEADNEARAALMHVRSGNREHHVTEQARWVKSEAEMRAAGQDSQVWQDAITVSSVVAAEISTDAIPDPKPQIPAFRVPKGFRSADDYLRHLAFRGAEHRYDEIPFPVIERLNLELEIIGSRRAADSLLIVHDLVTWCKDDGILIAPRGTSTSSLVLYCLGVTNTDPLRHNLKFERFLRAGRDVPPSLGFEIQSSRRQDALDYLAARWPHRVARVSTYARVKEETVRSRICDISSETAARLDGRIKTATTSACAILIAADDLHDTMPYRPDHRDGHGADVPIALWESFALSSQGYLVLDVLSSPVLDIIAMTADAVRATPEGRTRLGVLLPDGDGDLYASSTGAAWDLVASGDTDGIFQLGADHVAAAAKSAKPRNLTDMAALIALTIKDGRVEPYLKAGKAPSRERYTRYDHLTTDSSEQMWIASALDRTRGVLAFQDQSMHLFTTIGGFSDVEAGDAWRFLAKLSPDLDTLREKFIEGAVKEHYDRAGDLYSPAFSEATAARVFDLLVSATPGSFNAAHAYAYARLTFQTAWLKANFPETFQRVLDEVKPNRVRRIPA